MCRSSAHENEFVELVAVTMKQTETCIIIGKYTAITKFIAYTLFVIKDIFYNHLLLCNLLPTLFFPTVKYIICFIVAKTTCNNRTLYTT